MMETDNNDINYIVDNELLPIGEGFLDACTCAKLFTKDIDVDNPKLSFPEYEFILGVFADYLELSYLLNRGWVDDHPNIFCKYHDSLKLVHEKLMEIEKEKEDYIERELKKQAEELKTSEGYNEGD